MKKYILSILGLLIASNALFAQTLDRSIRPTPGPAPTVNLGDAESFVSSNGIKVYVVENHKLPRVSYSIDLDVKPALEKDKVGAAGFVGDLLNAGTKNMSKEEFNKSIDMIGGRIAVSAEGMYMQSLKKHSEKLLTLASDMILNPNFSQEELDKIKKQTISGLATEKDDPQAMSRNLTAMLNFGKNHYRGEIMTEETVSNVTLEDCKKYYDTYYRPNVAYMAIVGDITKAEAKQQVEKYFGAWKKKNVPVATYKTPEKKDGATVGIVNKSGAVQSVINVTYPLDLKPNNKDIIPLKVANGILGGGSTGRLFQNLRETHAWTYGSYSSIRSNKWDNSGSFSATANSTASATDSSVAAILMEMNKLRNEKVTDAELEGYKNYMTGIFALGLENPRTLASYAINIAKNNLPKDYYKNYLKNIEKVTAEDVMRVSKKYIQPGIAQITVAGDKNSNMAKLKKFGPVTVYDIYGNVQKDVPMKAIPAGMTAKQVIENYLDKTGGMKNWAAVKDMKMEISMTGAAPMPIDIVSIKKGNTKVFEEVSASMQGKKQVFQKTVFNGKTGKTSGMGGNKDITGDAVAENLKKAIICDELAYLDGKSKLKITGVEQINGEDCYAVSITDSDGDAITDYYSMNSGLKLQSISTVDAQNGKTTAKATFSDYKTVNGLKVPFSMTQSVGPQNMVMTVKSVEINKGVEDSVFE